jgi:hypothetical protein
VKFLSIVFVPLVLLTLAPRVLNAAGGAAVPAVTAAATDASNKDERGGRVTGSLGVGFDSFQEKYSIVDDDTLDSITEFRSRLSLGYTTGTFFKDYFLVEGRTMLGDDSYETTGRLKITKLLQASGAARIGFDCDVTRRTFMDNSSYEYANDYTRLYVSAYLKKVINDGVSFRLSERLEQQHFDERTDFDYNHVRNSVSLAGDFDWGLTTYLNTGVRFTTMSIPDSTEIEYWTLIPTLEFRHDAGLYKRFVIHSSAERREYDNEGIRSPFWAILALCTGQWPITDSFSLLLENDLEFYNYDSNSDVYFDYAENRSALLVNFNRSWTTRVGAGPTYGFFTSHLSQEDEYKENGAKISAAYSGGTRAWISLDYETGRRNYSAYYSGDDEAIFSDYTYNRFSFFANVKLWNGLSASGLLDYQPEDHEREGDDATATLFSLSVDYIF